MFQWKISNYIVFLITKSVFVIGEWFQDELYHSKTILKQSQSYPKRILPRMRISFVILFKQSVMAHIPLATKDKLLNKDFPVPISFIYGDDDWVVKEVDGHLAYDVV